MILDTVTASSLFSATLTSGAQLENVQQRVLSRGLEHYSKNDYETAIKEFQRSISYAPRTDNAVKAYQLIAQSYSKLNNSEGAINAYKQALKIDNNQADIHVALGNVHYFLNNHQEAVTEYEAAVRLDSNEANHYSLAQGYLALGNYEDAEKQFNRVKALAPGNPAGDYGLGLVYEKQKQYEAAIGSFENALKIKSDYYEAYSEMGFVMADMGKFDEAWKVQEDLSSVSDSLSSQLQQYIDMKTPPKILLALSGDFDTVAAGPGTNLANLSEYLTAPESSQTFSVNFYFNKFMDPASVQNIYNWTIGRSDNSGPGTAYNYGLEIPETEVTLPPNPVSVYYDVASQSATVFFKATQNSAGNGTLDPSHIQFKFSGKDLDGLAMDSKYDQYTGFSGVV